MAVLYTPPPRHPAVNHNLTGSPIRRGESNSLLLYAAPLVRIALHPPPNYTRLKELRDFFFEFINGY